MNDLAYMELAFLEAKKAFIKDEIPVGAVLVVCSEVVAKAHNLRHSSKNVLEHAEIRVLNIACKKLKRWILDDATLYVTLEPCIMCAGALMQSRIKRVVYGVSEPKFGALGSVLNLNDFNFNHKIEIKSGFLEEEIKKLMQDFFKELRKGKVDEDRKNSNK